MPLIRLETTEAFSEEQASSLCEKLSRIAAEATGKPEQYVEAIVQRPAAAVRFSGSAGPAAFVEVRSVGGLTPKVNREIAERVCALLAESGIAGERVYLNFTDVPASHWGFDGSTFG